MGTIKNLIEWLWQKYVATDEEKEAIKQLRLWNAQLFVNEMGNKFIINKL